MRKQMTGIFALTIWLILAALYMLLSNRFDLAFFFVLCFIGLLVIMQLMEPEYVKPAYLKYLRYIIAAGLVIFVIIVTQKVMEILGLEFVF